MPILKSKHVHFLTEIKPARIRVREKLPLELLDFKGECDFDFGEAHIAPAIADPHVHFRESYLPTKQEWGEFWEQGLISTSYPDTLHNIAQERANYTVEKGILAALKGGAWLVGAMSNTAFPAITKKIWEKTIEQYQSYKLTRSEHPIYFHLWHYAHPSVKKITKQCAKDFGSTFGSSGFSTEQREQLYQKHRGSAVRFHNDRARKESIAEFLIRQKTKPEALLHDFYYTPDLVLKEQATVYKLAKKYELATLVALHIPSGSALKQMLEFQLAGHLNIELEIGLDYLVNNSEQKINNPTRWMNYRRPAHTSFEEQKYLINLLKKNTQNDRIWIGSDHAPHTKEAKTWKNKLPSSPGTRCLEFYGVILQNLVDKWGFSFLEIDRLASYNPQKHLLKYMKEYQNFLYPIGSIETGNMANLRIFEPNSRSQVSEKIMANWLKDPEYHSSLCTRGDLRGQNLMTIVNGVCFDTRKTPMKIKI